MTNDRKKELLTQFVQNAELVEALKEELLRGIYHDGVIKEGEGHNPDENWVNAVVFQGAEVSDALIGQEVRAKAQGISFLKTAFNKILETYKQVPEKGNNGNKNPAR